MKKREAVRMVYEIATLTHPSEDILDLLCQHPIERCLEVLLILRQSPKKVKAPERFIIRALEENWTPDTVPQKVDRRRKAQNRWSEPTQPQENNSENDEEFPFYNWVKSSSL